MALGHLLYLSDATWPLTHDELEGIRLVSEQNNQALDVTGVLFYSSGHFVQLLEGDEHVIRRLFDRIACDRRHHHVRLLIERPASERIFADWSMGLLDLGGYSETDRRNLDDLIHLAGKGVTKDDGTPIELEILSRFCMLLAA